MSHIRLPLLLAGLVSIAWSQKPAPVTTATVLTHAGATHQVTGLVAYYLGERQGQGEPPRLTTGVLHLKLEGRQDGAKWSDTVSLPFSGVLKITLAPPLGSSWAPYGRVDWQTRGPEVRVDRRDGSAISITMRDPNASVARYTYEELAKAGKVQKSVSIDSWGFETSREIGKAGPIPVMATLELWEFQGRSMTPLGRSGTFSLRSGDVRTIEFR